MLQLRRWFITLFLLFCIVAGLSFIKYTQVKAAIAFGASFPEPSETVETTKAQPAIWQPSVSLVGEVKAKQIVEIRNEVEGMITQVNLSSGSKVVQGQVLIQLNIDTEKAQLDAINAEIDLAKLDVKRFADLLDVRASSKEQLDRAKSVLAVNQARARGLEAQIAKKTIQAPFNGTVNIHDWQVGTYIAANSVITNLLGDTSTMFIDFNLPQAYANIQQGQLVDVTVKDILNTTLKAEVIAINQSLNNASRTLQARAKIANPSGLLKPGIVVSVQLPNGNPMPVIPLPNEAIRYDAFGTYVFVLNKDEKGDLRATKRSITVASKLGNTSYVDSGIEAGETIATIGSAKLLPNMLAYGAQ